jgi:hypothetical protein
MNFKDCRLKRSGDQDISNTGTSNQGCLPVDFD